jgi:hypothetical protein
VFLSDFFFLEEYMGDQAMGLKHNFDASSCPTPQSGLQGVNPFPF